MEQLLPELLARWKKDLKERNNLGSYQLAMDSLNRIREIYHFSSNNGFDVTGRYKYFGDTDILSEAIETFRDTGKVKTMTYYESGKLKSKTIHHT